MDLRLRTWQAWALLVRPRAFVLGRRSPGPRSCNRPGPPLTAPEPTLPVTDRRAYGADDDDDLPVDVVRFAQFSLAADNEAIRR